MDEGVAEKRICIKYLPTRYMLGDSFIKTKQGLLLMSIRKQKLLIISQLCICRVLMSNKPINRLPNCINMLEKKTPLFGNGNIMELK